MLQTTNRELMIAHGNGTLHTLATTPLPGLMAYQVAMLLKEAEQQIQVVNAARGKMIESIGITEDPTPEQLAEFQRQYEDVLEQPIQLDVEPIALDELAQAAQDATFTPAMWLTLRILFTA